MEISAKKTIYVAMSGGVDSSVAAGLLKKQGHTVVGVFMKPWSRFASSSSSTSKLRIRDLQSESGQPFCPWRNDREDAMRVAAVLDIPLLTWDFSKEYGKEVTQYMLDTYRRGDTPNPDVMCNKEIKFGLFLKKALREGADFIATGHYAKKVKSQKSKAKSYKLLRAKDGNKDQTYFLWTLTQAQLSKTLFPVGGLTKPEVRKLAKKFKLPVFDKKDSQGVCFIGPLHMKAFLKSKIKPKSGNILNKNGKIIGQHDGVYYYTIGQRHGLDIKLGSGPYYVVAKDLKKNIIRVGSEDELFGRDVRIKDMHMISGALKFPIKLSAQIRYRAKPQPAVLHTSGQLEFIRPQRAVTAGQSAVFYNKQEVLGGGIIKF